MARKRVVVLNADKTVGLGRDADSVEGYYLGYKTITTDYGPNKLHVFQTETGNVGVFGFGNLDTQLAAIKPGTMTYVTEGGRAKTHKKGRKPAHLAVVEYDDDLAIDVSVSASNGADSEIETESAEEPEDMGDDVEAVEAVEEEDVEEPVAAKAVSTPKATVATATLADAKSKAQALLAKARSNSLAK